MRRHLIFVSLCICACAHRAPLESVMLPPVEKVNETVLVDRGFSSQGHVSPDGSHLIFVSAARPGHSHPQIYEKDLATGEEKRITFQNGATAYPRYHPRERRILYSSSTDELKESPPRLAGDAKPLKIPRPYEQPYEIYSHSLDGLNIDRLTDHLGFDGEAAYSADGRVIHFTRAKGESLEAMAMTSGGLQARPIKEAGPRSSQYVTDRGGKRRAWVEWDESYGVGRLKLKADKNPVIELNEDMVVAKTDLQFSPDGKWLVWSQYNPQTKTYQLWSSEVDSACSRRLTANEDGDRIEPAFMPDVKGLVVTATRKDRSRIVAMPFGPPAGPCVSGAQAVP